MAEPGSPPPKFPTPRPAGPTLALPRRNAASREPFVDPSSPARPPAEAGAPPRAGASRLPASASEHHAEQERLLRQLQLTLVERERVLGEAEARIAERERELAETDALLVAREQLLAAARRTDSSPISVHEKEALEQLRAALDQQQATIQEAKQAIREREQFLDESENRLFSKVQAQQEKEIELEQREEDLRARERQFREAVAAVDPQAAEVLKAEDTAAKSRDEFTE